MYLRHLRISSKLKKVRGYPDDKSRLVIPMNHCKNVQHIAMCYSKLEKPEKAKEFAKKTLEFKGTDTETLQVRNDKYHMF